MQLQLIGWFLLPNLHISAHSTSDVTLLDVYNIVIVSWFTSIIL